MNLNKIYILILLFACVNHAQTYRDIDIYKGDSHTLSFEAPYDVSSDSLLFVVKADRDDDTPRVIALRNTAGGGSDSEIEVIFSAVSTILVKLTQIHTEGLTAALYVYDLTIDSTTTLYTGYLKLRDEVAGSADGIATRTPYYTIVIDTPGYSPSFIIGQDLDNSWNVHSRAEFGDSISAGIDTLSASKVVFTGDSVGIRGDLDVDGDVSFGNATDYINFIKGTSFYLGLDGVDRLRVIDIGAGGYVYTLGNLAGDYVQIESGATAQVNIVSSNKITLGTNSIQMLDIPSDSTSVTTGYLWFNSTTGAIHRKF